MRELVTSAGLLVDFSDFLGAVERQPMSEADLVRDAQRGDTTAFEELYRQHVARIYGLCLRMCANPAKAEASPPQSPAAKDEPVMQKQFLAAGDVRGMVRLMRYPALGKIDMALSAGHAGPIAEVRFWHNDKMLLSAGKSDGCVMLWKVHHHHHGHHHHHHHSHHHGGTGHGEKKGVEEAGAAGDGHHDEVASSSSGGSSSGSDE